MLLSFALLVTSLASCPVQQAEYRLRDDPDVVARFYPIPAQEDWRVGLALRVRVARTGRSYWFLPWQGGTDGKTNLAWVRERDSPFDVQGIRQDMEFFTTDARYEFNADVPKAGDMAPIHMFIPSLTDVARHSMLNGERDHIPRSFFDLAGCEPPADPNAAPQIEFPAIP